MVNRANLLPPYFIISRPQFRKRIITRVDLSLHSSLVLDFNQVTSRHFTPYTAFLFPLLLHLPSSFLPAISHLSLTSRTLRMLEKRVFLSITTSVSSRSRLSRKCSVRTRRDLRYEASDVRTSNILCEEAENIKFSFEMILS